MLIQVNTDNHIDGREKLAAEVQASVESALERFAERLTRVEVHLSDENSRAKTHGDPMRCRLEARPAGQQPVVVTADGATIDQAVSVATKKLEKLLESAFGRLDDRRG